MNPGRRLFLYASALAGWLLWLVGVLAAVNLFVGRWLSGESIADATEGLVRGTPLLWLSSGAIGLIIWAINPR